MSEEINVWYFILFIVEELQCTIAIYSSISQVKNNKTIVFIYRHFQEKRSFPFKVYTENLISYSNQDYGSTILKSWLKTTNKKNPKPWLPSVKWLPFPLALNGILFQWPMACFTSCLQIARQRNHMEQSLKVLLCSRLYFWEMVAK